MVNNVHAGAGAMASKEGATWKSRLGEFGTSKINLGRLGYPIGAFVDLAPAGQVAAPGRG